MLYLTRYAGPAIQEGGRLRYQVTVPGEYFSVSEAELEALMLELAAMLDALAVEARQHAGRKPL